MTGLEEITISAIRMANLVFFWPLFVVSWIIKRLQWIFKVHQSLSPGKQISNPPCSATRHHLSDGRALAYHVYGDLSAKNAIFWLHGLVSSRMEVTAVSEKLLKELDMVLIGVDRPSYGASDAHPDRSYRSFTQDLEQLANGLGVDSFFVVGCSAGGPYAWATAYHLAHRVRGILLIASAVPFGMLTLEEHIQMGINHMGTAALTRQPWLLNLGRALCRYPLADRLLFHIVLKPIADWVLIFMAAGDRQCILQDHREYLEVIIPESVRQGSAACLFEDLALLWNSWDFDIMDLHPDVAKSVHIWHGTGDMQVPCIAAHAFKRQVPDASLRIFPGGGHFDYFIRTEESQREALSGLIASGRKF